MIQKDIPLIIKKIIKEKFGKPQKFNPTYITYHEDGSIKGANLCTMMIFILDILLFMMVL